MIIQEQVERATEVSLIKFTYSDCGQQPLRHVSHNDADEEDDSLQPGVSKDKGEDEERHTKEEEEE